MKKIIQIIAFITFAACASGTSQEAQQLWDKSTVGMSSEQVMQLYKNVKLKPQTEKEKFHTAQIESFEINGEYFQVEFLFDNNRLIIVTLIKDPTDEIHAYSILDLLKKKYGKPIMDKSKDDYYAKAEWLNDGIDIHWRFRNFSSRDRSLTIKYMALTRIWSEKL